MENRSGLIRRQRRIPGKSSCVPIILLATAALLGCGGTNQSLPAGASDGGEPDGAACPEHDFAAFDRSVSEFLPTHGLAGATAVVVQRECGIVHVRGYGQYAADRISLMGSSSKIVTVGVLMRLADQGLVDLDAPIGQYVPTWEPNGKPELEVAQLLSNSAGLVGLIDNPFYLPYRCQYQDTGTLRDCARSIYVPTTPRTASRPIHRFTMAADSGSSRGASPRW